MPSRPRRGRGDHAYALPLEGYVAPLAGVSRGQVP